MNSVFSNIILIGMAGAGKSTTGTVLASLLGKRFVDTDDLIAERAGMELQQCLESLGTDRFQQLEEEVLLDVDCTDTVIATGGSAVYSERGMARLRTIGPVVLLEVDPAVLEQRVLADNVDNRGLVNPSGKTFRELERARRDLYRRWADFRVDGAAGTPEQIAAGIRDLLAQNKTPVR